MKRRLHNALIAFALTLATAGILYQSGWKKGWRDARRPWTWATPAPSAFTDPATQNLTPDDYAVRMQTLRREGAQAATNEAKRAVANRFYQLGQSAHFRDRGAGAISLRAYLEALRLLEAAGDRDTAAGVLGDLASTQQLLGQMDAAETSLENAIAIRAAGIGTRTHQTELLNRLGDLQRQRGRYQEARRTLDRALGQANDTDEVAQQADSLRALGRLAFEEGSLALARQLLRSASFKYARVGQVEARAAVWGQIGDIALAEGKLDEAEDFFARGLTVWQERKQGFWTGRFLARQARVALAKGDLAAAERLARESEALLAASNGPAVRSGALLVLAQIAHQRGETARAKALLDEATELRKSADDAYGTAECRALQRRWQK